MKKERESTVSHSYTQQAGMLTEINQVCLPLYWYVVVSCDPRDCSLAGFSLHWVLQARILEWVAISFSRRIFPTQGLNPGLLHFKQILY